MPLSRCTTVASPCIRTSSPSSNQTGGMARKLRQLAALDVDVLAGVGPKKRESLSEMEIENVLDLLTHYPRRYIDRTQQIEIRDLQVGVEGMVLARVKRTQGRRTRQGRSLVEVDIFDGSGYL